MSDYRSNTKPLSGVRLNTAHSLAQSLVCAYLFNEPSGTRTYDSVDPGQVLNATSPAIMGYPLISSYGGSVAKINPAGSNTGSFIGTDKNLVGGAAPFTVSWRSFRFTASFNGEWAMGTSGSTGQLRGWRDNSDNLQVTFLNWTTDVTTSASSSILNRWIHWTVTYDGTSIRIYENGTLLVTTAVSLNCVKTGTLSLGGDGFSGQKLDGNIDFWYFYNRCLNPSEVTSLVSSPFQMYQPVSSVRRNFLLPGTSPATVNAVTGLATANFPVPTVTGGAAVTINAVTCIAITGGFAALITGAVSLTPPMATATAVFYPPFVGTVLPPERNIIPGSEHGDFFQTHDIPAFN